MKRPATLLRNYLRLARIFNPLRLPFQTWTTPVHRSSGAIASSSDENAQVLDNLNWLYGGMVAPSTLFYVGSGNYTTTSATFANISANLTLTVTVASGRAYCLCSFQATSPAGSISEFRWNDSVSGGYGDATHGQVGLAVSSNNVMVTMFAVFTGLSAASHTFTPQFRSVTSTNTTTVNNNGLPIQMIVWGYS